MGALLPNGRSPKERDEVVRSLKEAGVEAGALSYSMDTIGSLQGPHPSLPNANDIMNRGFALPLYPTMTEREQDVVVDTLHEVMK